MAILNYTTQIKSEKTVAEIQKILATHGARSISLNYDADGNPESIAFMVVVKDFDVSFRLPSNHYGVLEKLKSDKDVQRRFKNEEQARRVSWRIIKNWIEAQMAIIDAGLASLSEVFLPYAMMPDGETIYQRFEKNHQKFLE